MCVKKALELLSCLYALNMWFRHKTIHIMDFFKAIFPSDADPLWMNGFDIYESDNNTFSTKLTGLIEYKYTPALRGNRIFSHVLYLHYILYLPTLC